MALDGSCNTNTTWYYLLDVIDAAAFETEDLILISCAEEFESFGSVVYKNVVCLNEGKHLAHDAVMVVRYFNLVEGKKTN